MPGLRVGLHLALVQGRPVSPPRQQPSRRRNFGRSRNPWSWSPGRPVRINCVLGNQFESSQLHHALHRCCVSHTCYETTRHVKDLAPGFRGFRVSGGALTREILVSARPVSGAWTVSWRGTRRPVRQCRRPVRKSNDGSRQRRDHYGGTADERRYERLAAEQPEEGGDETLH
jgi:hypothetical protein